MSEVIITGPGSYRTVDGRKVTIEKFTRGSGRAIASNLNCIVGGKRVDYSMQVYDLDGSVFSERSGEENDRIVGPWVEQEPVVPKPGLYRTRDGSKVRVTRVQDRLAEFKFDDMVRHVFNDSGKANCDDREVSHDIVGPWVEQEPVAASPVQEVNTKRVVPGTYGIVTVGRHVDTGAPLVSIPFIPNVTAEQLRDAARILNELADFIDA